MMDVCPCHFAHQSNLTDRCLIRPFLGSTDRSHGESFFCMGLTDQGTCILQSDARNSSGSRKQDHISSGFNKLIHIFRCENVFTCFRSNTGSVHFSGSQDDPVTNCFFQLGKCVDDGLIFYPDSRISGQNDHINPHVSRLFCIFHRGTAS